MHIFPTARDGSIALRIYACKSASKCVSYILHIPMLLVNNKIPKICQIFPDDWHKFYLSPS